MADALEILETIQQLNIVSIAGATIAESKELILAKNRQQLMEGRLSTGKDITPSYLDDPYFKSREAAQRYSDWKDEITPNPKRKKGTPNYFITGPYHRSIDLKVTGEDFEFHSSFKAAQSIEKKVGDDIYGLTDESKEDVIAESLEANWQKKVEAVTGLKFS